MQSNYDKGLNQPDHSFKFKLMGDSGVGKSYLLLRLINNTFAESFISTIGSDFLVKNMPINGGICELKIFDTAGEERLKKPTSDYTPSTNVYMICFDVTNPETFNNVQKWSQMVNEVDSNAIQIVVATKCDLVSERKVSSEDAQEFCQLLKMDYIETSSKNNAQVLEAFQLATLHSLHKVDKNKNIESIIDANKYKPQKQFPQNMSLPFHEKPHVVPNKEVKISNNDNKPIAQNATKQSPKKAQQLSDEPAIKKQISEIKNLPIKKAIQNMLELVDIKGLSDLDKSQLVKSYAMNLTSTFSLQEIKSLITEINNFSQWNAFSTNGPLHFLKDIKVSTSMFSSTSAHDEIMNMLTNAYENKLKEQNTNITQENKSEKMAKNTTHEFKDSMHHLKEPISVQQSQPAEPPLYLICPISLELMTDPVMVITSGQTYERANIEKLLNKEDVNSVARDPKTNIEFRKSDLKINYNIKDAIDDWRDKNEIKPSIENRI